MEGRGASNLVSECSSLHACLVVVSCGRGSGNTGVFSRVSWGPAGAASQLRGLCCRTFIPFQHRDPEHREAQMEFCCSSYPFSLGMHCGLVVSKLGWRFCFFYFGRGFHSLTIGKSPLLV